MNRLLLSALCLTSLNAVACQSTPLPPDSPVPPEFTLDGWGTERIALPPGFAPSLPEGDELLAFAPGMFDAEAEDFWSYAFVMQLDRAAPDAEALDEILEAYYDGLMLAVAGDKDVGADPANVQVMEVGKGRHEASIELIDAFVTFEPIRLRVLIDVESLGAQGSFLRVQASPQDAAHEIWGSLGFAARTLEL